MSEANIFVDHFMSTNVKLTHVCVDGVGGVREWTPCPLHVNSLRGALERGAAPVGTARAGFVSPRRAQKDRPRLRPK